MKRRRALLGAPSLTCRSDSKVEVFRGNDLSALMLTLGLADFSPPRQSFTDSASAYLRKTPRIIPQPGGKKQTPAKNHRRGLWGRGHQPLATSPASWRGSTSGGGSFPSTARTCASPLRGRTSTDSPCAPSPQAPPPPCR